MQANSTTKTEITFDNMPSAVAKVYDEVSQMRTQLDKLSEKFEPKQPTEYLTRAEVSELLKCDLSTIWLWCKKGKLKPYGIGNRVYFLRTDISEAIKPLK